MDSENETGTVFGNEAASLFPQEIDARPGKRLWSSLMTSLWRSVGGWLSMNTFTPGFLTDPWRHPVIGYIVAVLVPLVSVTITLLLLAIFSFSTLTDVLPLLGIACVALLWGTGPGLLATLNSTVLLNVVILSPQFTWSTTLKDVVETVLFLALGLILSFVVSRIEKARTDAEVARERVEELVAQLEVEKEALRRSEQHTEEHASQLEATIEAITDLVLVYNRKQEVIRSNSAARQLNTLITQPGYGVRPARERLMQYEIRDEQGQSISDEQLPITRILEGEVLTSTNAEDVRILFPDGRDVQLSVIGAPIRDKEGQLVGGVLVCRDVTERRQLERRTHESLEALLVMAEELVQPVDERKQIRRRSATSPENAVAQRLAELIRSLLGCQRVSITTLDPETNNFNSIAVVGLPPEQEKQWRERQAGSSLSEQFTDPGFDEHLRANEILVLDWREPPLRDRPNPYGITTMLLAPMTVGQQLVGVLALDYGGQEHVYSQHETALAKAVAKLAALVIERERLLQARAEAQASELALREANLRMDEFIGIASHELKTPLTTIKGSMQLAQRQLKRLLNQESVAPGELSDKLALLKELLERAERQVGIQNRLVNDLLDVSSINVSRLELHIELCDLASIVREAVEDQRYVAPTRKIQLEIGVSEVLVLADADRLGQVVNNYLSNALKYSEANRPVEVRLEKERSIARVSVCDQGPGLTSKQQKQIWDRFYRVEGIEVKSGSGVGLGLGLHICRTIVERQGGHVGVQSKPGHGSTFWFTLPLAEPDGP